MVPSIARQSVIIKCSMQKSVLTGNYEFYYAAGLLKKLYGVEIPPDIKPLELKNFVSENLKNLSPKDEKEQWLFRMLSDYVPFEEYDDQMKELLLWGMGEEYLWSVNLE